MRAEDIKNSKDSQPLLKQDTEHDSQIVRLIPRQNNFESQMDQDIIIKNEQKMLEEQIERQ